MMKPNGGASASQDTRQRSLSRRHLLQSALTLGAGCSLGSCAWMARPGSELPHVTDTASGRSFGIDAFARLITQYDIVLLGELHDNAVHHRWRGECLALAARRAPGSLAIVAEHLTSGQRAALDGALLPVLAAAGFDAGSWQWPLHEPLFAPLLSAGLAVLGGNITREQARFIAREGGRAIPAELMALLAASPLSDTQRAALDEALIKGHCGTLSPGPRLEAMRWAQRARDAALWAALDSVGTGARRTAVLLAGNEHVRLDHGVGQMARTLRPNLRVMAVGFLEDGDEVPRAAYSHLVVTRPAPREDPCRAFERRG